jgi:hypothetical protein
MRIGKGILQITPENQVEPPEVRIGNLIGKVFVLALTRRGLEIS